MAEVKNQATGRHIEKALEKSGKLTTHGRTSLDAEDFALPPSQEEKDRGIKGRYPIQDAHHAANARARVMQHGTPAEQATVFRKTAAKYPDLAARDEEQKKD